MISLITQKSGILHLRATANKLFVVLITAIILIVTLAVLQDLVESKRSGYAFYLSESLLFKTIWLLFYPILIFLYQKLKNKNLKSLSKTALFIGVTTLIHLLFSSILAFLLSGLFFEGRYGLFKFISYFFSHDFTKIIVIYSFFILGYKYFQDRKIEPDNQQTPVLDKLIINNGKHNNIISVDRIWYITSATPYVFVHLEDKKFLHSETLKSLCNQLDSSTFIRVHKTTVVNVSKIKSFSSRLNGDYDLLLYNGDALRLSRTYTATFKKIISIAHQVTV